MNAIRRLCAAAALLGGITTALPMAAGAQSVDAARREVERVVDRLDKLADESVRLGELYEESLAGLDSVKAEIAGLDTQATALEGRIGELQTAVGELAMKRFIEGDQVGGLGTLLVGNDDPTRLMERDAYAGLVASEAVGSIDSLDAATNDLAKIRAEQQRQQQRLERTIKDSTEQLKAVEDATAKFEELKKEAEDRLGKAVIAEEQARREAEAERQAAASRAAEAARQAEADRQAATRRNAKPPSAQPAPRRGGNPGGGNTGGATPPPANDPPSQPTPRSDDPAPAPAPEPQGDATPQPDPEPQAAPEPEPEPAPEPEPPRPKPGRDVPAPSPGASGAVEAAMSQLGVPYKYATASPGVSFDCSGLTSWAWGQAGVSLPHYSKAQFEMLPKVPVDQAQPGDLLFYRNPVGHVAMYIGNGQMIHAPRTGDVVKIATVNWGKVRDGVVGRPG